MRPLRRALCALLLLAACGDIPVNDRVAVGPVPSVPAPPQGRPLPSALSPGLGAPLAWAVAVDRGAREQWWYAVDANRRRSTAMRAQRARPQKPATSSTHEPTVSGRSNAAIEACIIARENGGSYSRGSNPTHFGRYQFSRSTWAANGGDPNTWGSASPEEQDRVFRTTVNRNGYRDWTPYNGC